MILYIIIIVILYFSYKKPIYAIVLILNINSIRALPELDLNYFDFRTQLEPNFVLSVMLPLFAYILIILKLIVTRGRISYPFDITDVFLIISVIIMAIYSIISPNFTSAIEYTFKYILIGLPLYYMFKIILINNDNPESTYRSFFKITVIISVVTGTLALYLANYVDFIEPSFPRRYMIPIARVSIPGVHPIPYSQAVGFGSLILFSAIYSNGVTLNLKKRKHIIFSLLLFIYMTFLLLLANTRGVLISLVIAIFFYIKLYPRKISKKTMRFFIIAILIGVIFAINFIDIESLFNRLLNSFNNDTSASERMILLREAFHVISTNPIGVGTYGFVYGYPHNIFLDYIVSFGIFGWILSLSLFTIIIYFYTLAYNNRKEHPVLTLLYSIIIYFFTETLISFTLWMHKGFYLSLGMFAVYVYLIKKKRKQINIQKQDEFKSRK